MRRAFIFLTLLISSTPASLPLRLETERAVRLVQRLSNPSGILNAETSSCQSQVLQSGLNKEEETDPPCRPIASNNNSSSPAVNTSIVDLRRLISDNMAACPNCSAGPNVPPDFTVDGDELQRRRMNDARNRNRRRDRTDWSTVNRVPPNYMRTLIPSYSLNYKDPQIGEELKEVHDQIKEPIDGCPLKDEARFVSASFLAQANESAGLGDYEEAKNFLKIAKNLADFATSVAPLVSEARDAYEFFTGKNAFTGESLSDSDRALAGLGMIPFLGGAIKGGKALVKLAKFAGKRFPKIYKVSENAARASSRIYKNMTSKKWSKVFEEVLPSDLLKGRTNSKLLENLRKDKGIPASWSLGKSKKGGGVVYKKPNSIGTDIRIMPGNPRSPYPTSRKPYVKIKRDGRWLDRNGSPLPSDKNPDAHIPLDEFVSPF